jgi:hypothetical protein
METQLVAYFANALKSVNFIWCYDTFCICKRLKMKTMEYGRIWWCKIGFKTFFILLIEIINLKLLIRWLRSWIKGNKMSRSRNWRKIKVKFNRKFIIGKSNLHNTIQSQKMKNKNMLKIASIVDTDDLTNIILILFI